MSISIHAVSVPIFVDQRRGMNAWLDKAASEKPEAELLLGRLAPDMRPLPAQYRMASDSAKHAVARLAGITAPAMPDVEAGFAELRDRCARTIGFVESVDPAALAGGAEREVELKFPKAGLVGEALQALVLHLELEFIVEIVRDLPPDRLDLR